MMKLGLSIFLFCVGNVAVHAQPSRESFVGTPTAKVMVVGTFHFHQTNSPNILDARHQKDVIALVDQLAVFGPNHIGLECTKAEEDGINHEYQEWLSGSHDLTKNERQQVGFRLAKKLDVKTLSCIDADHPPAPNFDGLNGWDAFNEYAKERGEFDGFSTWIPKLEAYTKEAQSFMEKASLADIMNWQNGADADHSNGRMLMIEVTVGVNDRWVGADWLGRFQGRNIRMFAATQKLVSRSDRILILVGNAHKRPLERLFSDSYEFTVEPTPWFVTPIK